MRCLLIFCVTCVSVALQCQHLPKPLTHVKTCGKFSNAVVQVNTERARGTGFIVDPNGWIITAAHVVIDPKTRVKDGAISVVLPKVGEVLAEEILPVTELLIIRDFAILKVDQSQLPFLELGNEDDVANGSAITIIGLPLSAMFRYPINPIPRFCLTGTIAANASLPLGNGNYLDTIFFQGISIKGISGSPIISHETGKVIGVVSTKLTGINDSLEEVGVAINTAPHMEIGSGGVGFVASLGQVINVLDTQLANGLGSGTGAADAAYGLKQAKRIYEKQHPRK
jgi:serine protease Do